MCSKRFYPQASKTLFLSLSSGYKAVVESLHSACKAPGFIPEHWIPHLPPYTPRDEGQRWDTKCKVFGKRTKTVRRCWTINPVETKMEGGKKKNNTKAPNQYNNSVFIWPRFLVACNSLIYSSRQQNKSKFSHIDSPTTSPQLCPFALKLLCSVWTLMSLYLSLQSGSDNKSQVTSQILRYSLNWRFLIWRNILLWTSTKDILGCTRGSYS